MSTVSDAVGLGASMAVVGVSTRVTVDAMKGLTRKRSRKRKRKKR